MSELGKVNSRAADYEYRASLIQRELDNTKFSMNDAVKKAQDKNRELEDILLKGEN